MHIVIDAHLAVKKIDGVTRYLIGLLSALPGIASEHRYTVLDLPRSKSGLPQKIFRNPNVSRVELNLDGPSPRQHLIMRKLLPKLKADLYHHPQFDLPFNLTVPSVITVHDLKYIFYPEFLEKKSWLKHLYIKHSLKYSVRKCNQIIAVSENTKRDLHRLCEIPAEKITTIYHGVENMPPAKLNGTFISAVPKNFILFVGTRRPHKNIENLIRMLKILREKNHLDVHLVVAGKGYASYDAPERVTEQAGLQEYVHFLDFVSEEQLPALYGAANLVALPSFYEGFGLPVLEAMAHRRPVLGSDVSSVPEVLGDAGLLVDPGNPKDMAEKAASVLSDEKLARKLSAAAGKRAQAFSWSSVAKATLEVYQAAAKNNKNKNLS